MNEKIGVIGGSSAYRLLKEGLFGQDIACIKKTTPFGDSAHIHTFKYKGNSFLFLSRHGDEGYAISAPFINYRANIWAFKELGVQRIISWSGPGIINEEYSIGDYVLPHDFIDETKGRAYTFFENKGIGFIRQKEPFCPDIRKYIAISIEQTDIIYHTGGIYVCTQGPRLETAAEIKKYKLSGGDMVGMTLVPEAQLARELEICYTPICYMTNYAEGISKRSYKKGELFEGMQSDEEIGYVEKAVRSFPDIIKNTIVLSQNRQRTCECKDAMLRYKKRGDIGEDWRKWI